MQSGHDTRSLDEFKSDLGGMSEGELKALKDDLNKRKDYDYSQHGGQPGPDSAWLWERIQAVDAELKWKTGGVFQSIGRLTQEPWEWLKKWLAKRILGWLIGIAAGAYLGGPVGALVGFVVAFLIVEFIWWLLEKLNGKPRATSFIPVVGASLVAALAAVTFAMGDAEDGPDRTIATVNPVVPTEESVQAPTPEPCQVTTHVPFWESRTALEFSPAVVSGGDTVTVVVTTDADGAAVFGSDLAGFHALVGGRDFGKGQLTGDRLVFTGQVPGGTAGSVPVQLAHGDFVFGETSGGCLTRVAPAGS